jgi:hypothetical protein
MALAAYLCLMKDNPFFTIWAAFCLAFGTYLLYGIVRLIIRKFRTTSPSGDE